jgi:hypothetical protein
MRRLLFTIVLWLLPGFVLAQNPPEFTRDVRPILETKCFICHGDKEPKAGLDVRTVAAIMRGGQSGPAVAPGAPDKSLLFLKIVANKAPHEKLPDKDIGMIRAWIDRGAKGDDVISPALTEKPITEADREFWSFLPPVRPKVPANGERNPIDSFVFEKLSANGLAFAREADRFTLLRRVTFDLIGLPPTPAEITAFVNDKSPDAWEKVIDRLLASPNYGERWGRHWLDIAGYADSEGILDADYVRTAAWRYRDYVIRSFNADMPYDRFLQEQIAGDEMSGYWKAHATMKELPPEVIEGLIATGFLRCASDTSRPDFVNIKNAPGYYFQTLDDTLRIVASSTMGLTLHCARCHNHKYDPIPQSDYYRMQAIFMSAYRPSQWVPQVQRRLLEATAQQEKEAAAHNALIDTAIAKLNTQKAELQKQFAERLFNERLTKLPEPIRDDVKTALATDPAKRTEVQKYLATKFEAELRPPAAVLPRTLAAAYPELAKQTAEIDKAFQNETAKKQNLPEIRALYDLPGTVPTHLLRRGDYLNPGPEVTPGVLSALNGQPFKWTAPAKDAKTSGRRTAFAQWLTQPDHPLTARVWVNRMWLHHFGEGIVATTDNFGRTGSPPSHPELLDWLACEFVNPAGEPNAKWSIKHMHRLILTSRTYRQSSTIPEPSAKSKSIDPENRLHWRQRLRRLEAEPLRDAVLAVAGNLNPQSFGPPVPMVRQGNGEVVVPDTPEGRRRSVYLQVRRSQPLSFLQVFDQPVIETNCTRRTVSTVASQALTLLNSEFLIRQAEVFAERITRAPFEDPVVLAFGRPATDKEKLKMTDFLRSQKERYGGGNEGHKKALIDLCQMLLSSNEFAYVD